MFEESEMYTDKIRILTISRNYQPNIEIDDLFGKFRHNWTAVNSKALGIDFTEPDIYFSAVCYRFGLDLYKALNALPTDYF